MAVPSPSRQHSMSAYGVGSVIRVKMDNFMTYKNAILEPGPSLNLVLGPNGTGKSSFVCALCVGLAGSTHLLGRADNVKEFIKRGEETATVEVTLSSGNPSRPIVVYRKMKMDKDSGGLSEWKLNGATCTMKMVKEKMKELNVQLDNLCQFLPQDKVVEFARMSPVELLKATQTAIGDSRLADLHTELIQEKKSSNVLTRDRDLVVQELEQQRGLNSRMERDVERFKNREQLLAKAKIMEEKIPWIAYNDMQEAFKEGREKLRESEKALAERKKYYDESIVPIGAKADQHTAAKRVATEKNALCKKLDQKLERLATYGNDMKDEVDKSKKDLQLLEQKYTQQQNKLKAAQADVDKAKDALANLPAMPENTKPQQDALQAQIKDLHNQNGGIKQQREELQDEERTHRQQLQELKGQLSLIDNVKSQRLTALSRRLRHDGLREAVDWINQARQNKQFRGAVYGPILLDVQVQDKQHAAYLEGNCSLSIWQRFVTIHQEDQDLLVQEAKKWRFRPIISNYQGNAQTVITHPKGDARQFARYGITHTLDEVFQAPNVIKHVMTDEANLNEAYVGTNATTPQVEKCLQENPRMANLWTPESHYSVRTSMYNPNARSQSVTATVPGSLLVDSVDSSQREALISQIAAVEQTLAQVKAKIDELKAQEGGNTRRMDELKAEKDALVKQASNAARQREKLRFDVTKKTKLLERLEVQPDPREKGPQLQKTIQDYSLKIAKLMAEGPKLLQDILAALKDSIAAEAHAREMGMQHDSMKRAMTSCEAAYNSYKEAVTALRQMVEQRKTLLKDLLDKAKEKTGGVPDDEKQQQFNGIADDVDVLQEQLQQLLGEAEGIACANPRVLQEYQERQRKIIAMERNLDNQDTTLANQQARIKELHDKWYPDLKATVEKINKTFQKNFRQIGCAGEVSLAEHEDYDKFAVQIKVKFRDDEDLQVLTASRQSGGERSVSTILYLISIQDVTVCPFRVVDEINQGMDPVNERKVFMQLVESACKPGTPQCFLLTPKLLPALPFTPQVQVLQIWNGNTIKEVTGSFKEDKVLGTRKRIRAYAG